MRGWALIALVGAATGASMRIKEGGQSASQIVFGPQENTAKLTATCEAAVASVSFLGPREQHMLYNEERKEVSLDHQNTTVTLSNVPSCANYDYATKPCVAYTEYIPPLFHCVYVGEGGEFATDALYAYDYEVKRGNYTVIDTVARLDCPWPALAELVRISNHTGDYGHIDLRLDIRYPDSDGPTLAFKGLGGSDVVRIHGLPMPPSPPPSTPPLPPPPLPPRPPVPSGPPQMPGLYEFDEFRFTTGKSSYSETGATASQFASAMSDVSWATADYYTPAKPFNGYQLWMVPADAMYTITAAGGEGGGQGGCKGNGGVPGALIQGDFSLRKGEILVIAVGSGGGNGVGAPHNGNERGGGGGSFIAKWPSTSFDSGSVSSATPLLIAGGGGGRPGPSYGCNCMTEACGFGQESRVSVCQTYTCSSSVTSTTGQGGKAAGSHEGGAGGGWNGNGQDGQAHCGGCKAGKGFMNGLVGGEGNTCYITDNRGGFGGGGGGCLGGTGGGGGYTGGNAVGSWSSDSGIGGGGSSYNDGVNQENKAGGGPRASSSKGGANGYIEIEKL